MAPKGGRGTAGVHGTTVGRRRPEGLCQRVRRRRRSRQPKPIGTVLEALSKLLRHVGVAVIANARNGPQAPRRQRRPSPLLPHTRRTWRCTFRSPPQGRKHGRGRPRVDGRGVGGATPTLQVRQVLLSCCWWMGAVRIRVRGRNCPSFLAGAVLAVFARKPQGVWD